MSGQVFMAVFNLRRVNRLSFLQLFCVQLIILWEVDVNKTGQGMSVSANSDISIFVMVLVDNLLSDSVSSLTVNYHSFGPGFFKVLLCFLSLISIELLFFSSGLHFFLVFVIFFFLPYLFTMILLKLKILAHDLMHVIIIYVNIYDLFTLFKSMIFLM